MEHIAAEYFKQMIERELTVDQAKSVIEQVFPELIPTKPQRYIRIRHKSGDTYTIYYIPTVHGLPALEIEEQKDGTGIASLSTTWPSEFSGLIIQQHQLDAVVFWIKTHHGVCDLEQNAPIEPKS